MNNVFKNDDFCNFEDISFLLPPMVLDSDKILTLSTDESCKVSIDSKKLKFPAEYRWI